MNRACSTPDDAFGKGGAAEIPRGSPVVAVLTPPGRGAIAVVGIEGRSALEILAHCFRPKGRRTLADRDDGAIVFGQWGMAGMVAPEDLVVVKRSPTSLEVHPHGGFAASERVLSDLVAAGCRRLSWPEWLAATGRSEIEVETRLALATATGPKAAAILCRQLAAPAGRRPGLLESAIDALRHFAAEGNRSEASRHAEQLLAWAPLGLRLTRPWRVVVAGEPNAGKSSLVNALAGFARSLVSPEPGTTRDVLETRIVLDGWEIDLVDTAGLRDDPASPTEQAGIAWAREAARAADLVLEIHGDGSDFPAAGGSGGARQKSLPSPFIHVRSKVDLLPATARNERSSDAIRTSAVTGEGIDTLAAAIIHRLVPREPGPNDAVPFTPRQVELLRSLASR